MVGVAKGAERKPGLEAADHRVRRQRRCSSRPRIPACTSSSRSATRRTASRSPGHRARRGKARTTLDAERDPRHRREAAPARCSRAFGGLRGVQAAARRRHRARSKASAARWPSASTGTCTSRRPRMPLQHPEPAHLAAHPADPALRRRVLPAGRLALATTDKNIAATVIFIVAALTDWLDGYLARAPEPDVGLRRVPRPGRRQADGGGGADRAAAARTASTRSSR